MGLVLADAKEHLRGTGQFWIECCQEAVTQGRQDRAAWYLCTGCLSLPSANTLMGWPALVIFVFGRNGSYSAGYIIAALAGSSYQAIFFNVLNV